MKRRLFLEQTSVVAFGLPIFLAGCQVRKETRVSSKSEDLDEFVLNEVSIKDLQAFMEKGTYTSRQLVEMYVSRIQRIDAEKSGPRLNSIIELNPDASVIATQMDEERKAGKVRSPLHGIPVVLKDNIDTADAMMTTAGSIAMRGNYAGKDAFIVRKLREAGAVIIAKTNLSEWANFRSTRSSSGWSSRGGQTKNAYSPDRNPCGSSSGSAVAVAANLCAIAIGTETNGSIACPSSLNGIVGIKPTVGLWSRSGIIPISATQDTAGPMTRTVTDAAIALGILAGNDPSDPATKVNSEIKDYSPFLVKDGLKGKRIGVEKTFLQVHEKVDALLQTAIRQMRDAGAEVVEVELLKDIDVNAEEYQLLQFEFKDGLNKYLASANGKVKSLKALIDFNNQNDSLAMPHFRQEILEASEAMESLESERYKNILKKVTNVRTKIDAVLKAQGVHAICGPTNGPAWCTDLVNGDFFTGYGMYSPAAMAGYPHITVPMGFVEKLPVGITFFSSAFEEPKLISIAYAYEQVSMNRRQPKFS